VSRAPWLWPSAALLELELEFEAEDRVICSIVVEAGFEGIGLREMSCSLSAAMVVCFHGGVREGLSRRSSFLMTRLFSCQHSEGEAGKI
jgi:hypothetical protein